MDAAIALIRARDLRRAGASRSTATTTSTESPRRRSWCALSASSAPSATGSSQAGSRTATGSAAPRSIGWPSRGTGLLITADCGITSVEEVEHAKSLGIDVVVTDHHQPGAALPDCPIVHPVVSGYPCPDLCAAGVAHKVAAALLGVERAERDLDLVALATIADMVPLLGENRSLVRRGLELMRRSPRLGLRALMEVSKVAPERVCEIGRRVPAVAAHQRGGSAVPRGRGGRALPRPGSRARSRDRRRARSSQPRPARDRARGPGGRKPAPCRARSRARARPRRSSCGARGGTRGSSASARPGWRSATCGPRS